MSYSIVELERYAQLYNQGVAIFKANRQNSIDRKSPYSNNINAFLLSVCELEIYTNLHLKEAFVTRPALLLAIDPAYKDRNGVTNLEKMLAGKAPVDVTTGDVIHIHHIGQQYQSPFAELPQGIHNAAGLYSQLHTTDKASWRNDKVKRRNAIEEIKQHWIKRGSMFV